MFTVNEATGGPRPGFDQNRLFGGLLRQLNSTAALEFGHLWQAVNQPGPAPRTQTNIAFVLLNLTLEDRYGGAEQQHVWIRL
jgi:hypothetical protein